MADLAHQEGNLAYRKGDLEKAEKSYALAKKLDATEPKYASNLSAVYFEQGRYKLCNDAIMDAWKTLRSKYSLQGQARTPSVNDTLASKLALRFLKAKFNMLANGSMSFHDGTVATKGGQASVEQDVQSFCDAVTKVTDGAPQQVELQQTWKVWLKKKAECEAHSSEECKESMTAARKRLRNLPIYRSRLFDVIEYGTFSHDKPQSLLVEGPPSTPSTGDSAMGVFTLMKENWKKISLLFGGFGDGRQIYSTIMHFAQMWRNLEEFRHPIKPKLHMTLFEIHPAAVCRVMLIFALIRKGMLAQNATKRLEFEATIFYLWNTIHVPDYCAQIAMSISSEVMEELTGRSPKRLTKLWTVDEGTKTKVLPILRYWSKPLPKNMETFYDVNGPNFMATSDLFNPMFRESVDRTKATFKEITDIITKIHGGVNRRPKDPSLPLYDTFKGEDTLFQTLRILLPPKEFLGRHPALEKFVKSKGKTGKEAVKDEVIKYWKPNPTVFDNCSTEHPIYSSPNALGYPQVSFDESPSKTTAEFLYFLYSVRDPPKVVYDQTSFGTLQQYFDCLRESFEILDGYKDALTLEFVCSELYAGLPKLIAGDLGPRPSSFPSKYMRMWLSNTPDYTGGILSNLIYLVPYLEDAKQAMIIWNCMSNTPLFQTLKDLSIHYTYLTASGIRRFFNCVLRDEDESAFEKFGLSILPRTSRYSSETSKNDLHNYLSSILLRALCCPRFKADPYRVDEPTNLISFIKLLVALGQTYKCPAHWLGDFVQSMVNDRLFTKVMLFDGMLPIRQVPGSKKEDRKLNLEPYQLELEKVVVEGQGAFPFFVTLPERYATSYKSIKTYTAKVEARFNLMTEFDIGPVYTTANLLFYKAGTRHTASTPIDLPSRIPALIESKDGMVDGVKVQIVSGIEEMNFETNRLVWRMSEGWYERMKEEGWSMVVWVTNARKTVSVPVNASAWQELIAHP